MTTRLPLSGLRVLDLSTLMPGPFATQMLVDLGATVLKVERPPEGDPLRTLIPDMFPAVNRGKASVVLDLKQAEDRSLFLDLSAGARVVIEGFRPGVLDRLGVGFEAVRERRPDIVFASLSGWGATGPLAADSGHNGNYLARTGAVALTGEPGQPPTDAGAIPTADLAASMYAVVAILAALADPSQEARHIDVSLFGAGLAWMGPRLAEYLGKGSASRDEVMARPASGVFRVASGGWITIAAVEDHFFRALCGAIGRDDLGNRSDLQRYVDRYPATTAITEAIEDAFATGTRDEWVERLRAHGVPVAPVLDPTEVADDPQVRHLGLFHTDPHPHVSFPVTGLPTRTPASHPALDEHGDAVRSRGWDALEGKP